MATPRIQQIWLLGFETLQLQNVVKVALLCNFSVVSLNLPKTYLVSNLSYLGLLASISLIPLIESFMAGFVAADWS